MKSLFSRAFFFASVSAISVGAQAAFSPIMLSTFDSVFQDNASYWKEVDLDMMTVCSSAALRDLRESQGLTNASKSNLIWLKTYRMNSVSTLYQGVTLYNMHFLPTNGADYAYLGGIEPVAFYRPKIMCSVSGFSTKEIGKFKKDIRESGVLIDEESGSAQPSILFESFASYSNSSRGPRVRFRAQYDSFESHVGMSISYQDLNDPERWIVVKESMDEYVSSSERKSLPAGKPSDYSGGWAYDFPRREDVTLERKTIAYDVKLPYPTLVRVSINAESDSAKPHVFLLNARLQTEECVVDASYEDGRCL